MAGLFSALEASSAALDAQQMGLDVVGQNLANVNTPGYAVREVDLAEIPPGQDGSTGGVTVEGIQAERDAFAQQQLFSAQPLASEQSTVAGLLDTVQTALGAPGQSLDGALSSFFSAWSTLASNPTSGTARQGVVVQGQALGQSFQQISSELTQVQDQADTQVRGTVTDISNQASQIASLNGQLAQVGGSSTPEGLAIQDELYSAVNSLSNDVGISVLTQSNGELNVSYTGGRALVVGSDAYGPTVTSGTDGFASVIAADGTDITSSVSGGELGGALQVRDTVIPGYQNQLDTLADTVVNQVNTVQTGGYDLNGNPGADFFNPIASVSGAAGAVAVSSAIVANPSGIAAAGSAAPGDNQNAVTMANLANQPVIGGTSTFAQGWGNLVSQVGEDTQVAQNNQSAYTNVVNQLQALNNATSGVSINDEAAMLLQYQRAYEANAEYFSTINSTLVSLLNMTAVSS